jgi:hypothetical protein
MREAVKPLLVPSTKTMLESHIKKGNKLTSADYINFSTSQMAEKLAYRKSSLFNEKFRGGVFSFGSTKFQHDLS